MEVKWVLIAMTLTYLLGMAAGYALGSKRKLRDRLYDIGPDGLVIPLGKPFIMPRHNDIFKYDLINPKEAAEILGISVSTLRKWREEKKIEHIKVTPRSIRYKRAIIIALRDKLKRLK